MRRSGENLALAPASDEVPPGFDSVCVECRQSSGGAERCPRCETHYQRLLEGCGIAPATVSGIGRGWWDETVEGQIARACPGAGRAIEEAIRDIAPTDALEGMLATQLAAAHCATMEAYARAARPGVSLAEAREYLNQANKLARTFTAGMEALNRHRGRTGQQTVRVEHVTVNDGGQAIVGGVTTGGEGG